MARRYSDAVKAGDYEAAGKLLHPDVEIVPPSGRPFGLAELKAGWAGPAFDHLEVTLEDRVFEPDGDGALMRGNQVFRWKENAELAYVRPLVTRYAFRDGRIVRIEMESP